MFNRAHRRRRRRRLSNRVCARYKILIQKFNLQFSARERIKESFPISGGGRKYFCCKIRKKKVVQNFTCDVRICNCNIYIFLKALPLAASPAPIAHTIGKFLCIMHFALLLLVDGRWCIAISYLCLIISAGVSESISQDITISSSVLLKSDDLNRYTTKGNAGILYYYTILLCCHVIRGRFWREPRVHMCVFIGNGSNFTTCGNCKFKKN